MRAPDLIVGPRDDPYLLRWHLFRWRGRQLALHKITRSDDDRALHDHSGDNVSLIVWGWYREVFADRTVLRLPFIPIFRRAETPHRLVLSGCKVVWTLWLRGPPIREWGFHCPKGWRHWREYVASREDYYREGVSEIGRGCD